MQYPLLNAFQGPNGRLAPVTLNWTTDGQATIDIRQDKSGLGTIGGFWINNSLNASVVIFVVQGTSQVITVPAGALGTIPIFMQGQNPILLQNGENGPITGTGQTSIIASDQLLSLALVQAGSSDIPETVVDPNVASSVVPVAGGTALRAFDGTDGHLDWGAGFGVALPTGALQQTIPANPSRFYAEVTNQDPNATLYVVLDNGGGNPTITVIALGVAAPDGSGGGSYPIRNYKGRIRLYNSANFAAYSE